MAKGSNCCCNCGREVGEGTKYVPIDVAPADGRGKHELWCPSCFAVVRMVREPERFNAAHTGAVSCAYCGAVSVSFALVRGRSCLCGRCGRAGATLVRLPPEEEAKLARGLVEALEARGAKVLSSKS